MGTSRDPAEIVRVSGALPAQSVKGGVQLSEKELLKLLFMQELLQIWQRTDATVEMLEFEKRLKKAA